MAEAWFDFDLLERGGFPLQAFPAGSKIFLEEDEAGCMYVVRSGRVNIITYGTVLDSVGPNGLFGEMALIDGGARSATAIALEDTEVAPIDKRAFAYLVREDPEFALRIMRTLVGRLRRMNESL